MNVLRKTYELSILATAALIPSGFYQLTLAMAAVAGACFLLQKDYKNVVQVFKQPQFFCLLLFYIYIFLGFFFSKNRGEALSSLSVYLQFILFPLLYGKPLSISRTLIKKAERIFIYSVTLSLFIAVVYALYDVYRTQVPMVTLGESVYSKYSSFGLTRALGDLHPTYLALFANHAIFLLIQSIVENYKKDHRVHTFIFLFIFFFLSASIFLLNSIMGILVYILILLYFSIVYLKKSDMEKSVKTILVVTFAIISFTFLYFNPFKIQKLETLKDRGLKVTDNYNERNLLTIRLAKWDTHFAIISNNLIFGTTAGDIKEIRKEAYNKKGYYDLERYNYNAHNQFIEVLTTYGIIGFIIFMSALVIALLKTRSRNFNLFLLITCITFLTESILLRQQGLNYFVFFFVLYTVIPQVPPESSPIPKALD